MDDLDELPVFQSITKRKNPIRRERLKHIEHERAQRAQDRRGCAGKLSFTKNQVMQRVSTAHKSGRPDLRSYKCLVFPMYHLTSKKSYE